MRQESAAGMETRSGAGKLEEFGEYELLRDIRRKLFELDLAMTTFLLAQARAAKRDPDAAEFMKTAMIDEAYVDAATVETQIAGLERLKDAPVEMLSEKKRLHNDAFKRIDELKSSTAQDLAGLMEKKFLKDLFILMKNKHTDLVLYPECEK